MTDCHTNRYHVDIPIFIQISEVKGPGDRLSHKQISCWYPYLYSDIRGKRSRWQTVTQTDIMLISLSFHSDIRGKGSRWQTVTQTDIMLISLSFHSDIRGKSVQVTDCHTNRYHVDIPIFIQISEVKGPGDRLSHKQISCWYPYLSIQISEVKGPGDRLSHKQISCWYPYLYSDIRGKGSRWQTVTQTDIMLISLSFHSDIRGKGSQGQTVTQTDIMLISLSLFRYQR